MLHIILVILKIAGILLAAVLFLLMLVLLLLLFVPLRYELTARHTGEETFVRGKVSWLLHLCTARVSFDYPGGLKLLVKVLWKLILKKPPEAEEEKTSREKKKIFRKKGKSDAGKREKFPPKAATSQLEDEKKDVSADRKLESPSSQTTDQGPEPPSTQRANREPESQSTQRANQELESQSAQTTDRGSEPRSTQTTGQEPEIQTPRTAEQNQAPQPSQTSVPDKIEADSRQQSIPMDEDSEYEDYFVEKEELDRRLSKRAETYRAEIQKDTEEASTESQQGILAKLRGFIQRIPEFFKRLWSGIQAIGLMLKGIWNKLQNLAQSAADLKAKIQHYLDIWNEEETKAFRKAVFAHVKYLLYHIRPRKVKGYLKYGFTDPSITGQLTGVLYVLRPVAFSGLELEPVFETEELILEGDLYLKGHIRAVHIVRVGLKLLFDKNLKHLRKRLKE